MGGIDKSHVGECLREITHEALTADVVFFGQEPHVVAQADDTLEKAASVIEAAGQNIGVGEPEAARQEGASPSGRPSLVEAVS